MRYTGSQLACLQLHILILICRLVGNLLHYSISNFSQNLFIMLNFILFSTFSTIIPYLQLNYQSNEPILYLC